MPLRNLHTSLDASVPIDCNDCFGGDNINGSELKNIETGRFKPQHRFRIDGRQPTEVNLTPVTKQSNVKV